MKTGSLATQILRSLTKVVAAIALALTSASLPATVSVNEAPPLSAYGELPEIERAALSPSGERIAALVTVSGARLLVAVDANNSSISRTNVSELKVSSFEWVGEDRLLLTYDVTEDLGSNFTADKYELAISVTIPMDGVSAGDVAFEKRRDLVNSTFCSFGVRQIDDHWYGFFGAIELSRGTRSEYVFRHGRPYLYRVDLHKNTTQRVALAAETDHNNDWLIDANGEVAATFDINRESGRWNIRNANRDVIAEGQSASERGGMLGLGSGGRSVIFYQTDDEGQIQRYEVSLSGGTPTRFLPGVDVDQFYFGARTGHLNG